MSPSCVDTGDEVARPREVDVTLATSKDKLLALPRASHGWKLIRSSSPRQTQVTLDRK